jgi:voltage-dependent potassium channel beta subunit
MKYRRVGKSGLVVSEIAYGSWLTFANQVELENAKNILRRAFELGINYIDSADVYENGKAEVLLGQILPGYNRSHYVVATKAFWPMSGHPTDKGLSRKHIVDSINGSLKRLKLDYVDIFYCHRYDPDTELEETLEAIEDIVRRGKTLYWGTSEWTAEQISEAVAICEKRGWHKPIINQPKYNMLTRGIEKDILPTCVKNGMGTANFSPLEQGILTGKYTGGKVPAGSRGSMENQNMWMKEHIANVDMLDKVDSMKPIAEKYGLSLAQLSLAWILHNPGISSVIMGATSIRQLEDNVKASGVELEQADFDQISGLFPIDGES